METIDTKHWFGIPFPDLDCPNWLPYLTVEQLGQDSRKLTLDLKTNEAIQEDFPQDREVAA